MILNPKFDYYEISRLNTALGRHYKCPDGTMVPSVTTVLSKTKSAESKKALAEWRQRVGEDKAEEITRGASNRGTLMHKFLENYIMGKTQTISTNTNYIHRQAATMAQQIITHYLEDNLSEVWGNEINLFYSGLYAGTTDCVGIWKGEQAIIDFKQTNRPKKREWIDDYMSQIVAYAHAHNHMYGTEIKKGIILMCSPDNILQDFELSGDEFDKYSDEWWNKVEQFHLGINI